MLEFLKEYKEVIVSGLAVILTIVCMLIKRKPKTIDDFVLAIDEVISTLPKIINNFEEPGNGVHKKKNVLETGLSLVSKKLGRCLSDTEENIALQQFDKAIEDILSTPHRKGDFKC